MLHAAATLLIMLVFWIEHIHALWTAARYGSASMMVLVHGVRFRMQTIELWHLLWTWYFYINRAIREG